jgi:hypothetical protein
MVLGGDDPLQGISAYEVPDPVSPHWHLISYGLSELYHKDSDDVRRSGWGFELTMRVKRLGDESDPPAWAMALMQNLARYVVLSGNRFDTGHHMDANSPLCMDRPTQLHAVCFAVDPLLGEIETANGQLRFLQIIGITANELEAIVDWNARAFLELAMEDNPLLVTDIDRGSYLDDRRLAEAAASGADRDGSSTGMSFAKGLRWTQEGSTTVLTIGALYVKCLVRGLLRRLPFARPFGVLAESGGLLLYPATHSEVRDTGDALELHLTGDAAAALGARIIPQRGRYAVAAVPLLVVEVEPTAIHDQEGNVVEVVG